MVAPQRLQIDPSYQRSLDSRSSTKLIGAIAHNWDWRLCVPLIVSQRADGLYVIDGQHRREAAAMRGDIAYLPCSVSTYASPAEEARLFVSANRARRSISRVDDFRAAVAAGQDDYVALDGMVRAAGLSIARHANAKNLGAGEIGFTSGLLTAFRRQGPAAVERALLVIGEAFPGQVLEGAGAIFLGLLEINRAERQIDHQRLVRALSAATPAQWSALPVVRAALGGMSRGLAMRRAILGAVAATPPVVPAMDPPPPAVETQAPPEPVMQTAPATAQRQKRTAAELAAELARSEEEGLQRQLAKVRAGAPIAAVKKIPTRQTAVAGGGSSLV